MRIIKVKDYQELSLTAARLIASQVLLKENSVIGLATGSTPEGMYKELVKMYENNLVNFESVISFNLDEYVGLEENHKESYSYYMKDRLFSHVNINKDNIHIPNGNSTDIEEECKNYEKLIEEQGGIDMQILGIGRNGHIGFNEPDVKFEAVTHVVELDDQTRKDNSRFFNSIEEVPTKAISMGIKRIMQSKKIILMAYGVEKADAIYGMIHGKIDPKLPASVLQLHPDVTVILEEGASSRLNL